MLAKLQITIKPPLLLQFSICLNVYILCRTVRHISYSGRKIECVFSVA